MAQRRRNRDTGSITSVLRRYAKSSGPVQSIRAFQLIMPLPCLQELSWLYTDQEAHEQLIDPASHRRFLNSFYVKRYPGSFARGLAYEEDAAMINRSISGTTASLAGLESGEENAVERILLMYSICFSSGGIPMINLGDEVSEL